MLENQFALTSYWWQYDVIFHSIKVTRLQEKNANLLFTQRRGSGNFRNLVFPIIIITIILFHHHHHCLLSLVTLALLELLWTTLPPPPRRAEPASFFLSPKAAPRAIPAFYWFKTNSTILFRSGTSGGYLGIAWALLGDNCETNWGLTVLRWTSWGLLDYFKAFCGLLGDYLVNDDHFGTTW